ncbi:MAG: GDP-L-fucose synthase [Ruminococcus sp.]|nr:GDP-L-fucose synthase [Ruminococcus sp.]
MERDAKIYVAGHRGMVGSSIVRALRRRGYSNIVTTTHKELDLTNQTAVLQFFEKERFDCVVLAAAKVGGIMANMNAPAEFLYENLAMEIQVIHSAYLTNVKQLLFLGSSCIYPRLCPQPMKEEYLMDGKVEPTNEGYAIAKIAGLKMCQMYNMQYNTNYISVMPCNIYGEGDNFDKRKSHVVAGLIRKFHEAKREGSPTVEIWGTGNARRELLYVDDLAEACVYLMETYSGKEFVNVGSGVDLTIRELAEEIKKVVGFEGTLVFDTSKPDGMPQKLLDVTRIHAYGWKHRIHITEGLAKTYEWYLKNQEKFE